MSHSSCWNAKLFLKKRFKDFQMEVVESQHHWHSFIDAVRGEGPLPSANFDYWEPADRDCSFGWNCHPFP